MEYIFIGEVVQLAKEYTESQKTLDALLKTVNESYLSNEIKEDIRAYVAAMKGHYERLALAYENAIAIPTDATFIQKWQNGDYGEIALREAVRQYYDEFLSSGEEENHPAFTYGMSVTRGITYTYNDELWMWTGDDLGACTWYPGSNGVWQWQKVEQ